MRAEPSSFLRGLAASAAAAMLVLAACGTSTEPQGVVQASGDDAAPQVAGDPEAIAACSRDGDHDELVAAFTSSRAALLSWDLLGGADSVFGQELAGRLSGERLYVCYEDGAFAVSGPASLTDEERRSLPEYNRGMTIVDASGTIVAGTISTSDALPIERPPNPTVRPHDSEDGEEEPPAG